MANHGVYVTQAKTSVTSPAVAQSGVPFVIGAAPVQMARSPANVGAPTLCKSWKEAVEKFGYSDDWEQYPICEFMYSHFVLYGRQPVIICNLLDPATMSSAVVAADVDVKEHQAKLPLEAIKDDTLIVKAAGGTGTVYELGKDYTVLYDGTNCIIELLNGGTCYSADKLSVAYSTVTPVSITSIAVAAGLENIELCMTTIGVVPDLICAPGHSSNPTVAAIMATKAAGINGIFTAKALIDIDTSAEGADTLDKVSEVKELGYITAETQLACWPLLRYEGRVYHYSTQLAGLIATVDADNDGCPYESPSNKALMCDSLVVSSGAQVTLTLGQANILNGIGVVTALNFMGRWACWGNYTACYPTNEDIKDQFIPISRMFDWVGNSLIYSFWAKLDKPMSRRMVDNVMNNCNIWLNGLVGSGYLLGARIEYREDENPLENLMAGIIKLHIYMTPPAPAQEIDFVLEYDAEYVVAAFGG